MRCSGLHIFSIVLNSIELVVGVDLASAVILINFEVGERLVLAQVELLRGVAHGNVLVLACIDFVASVAWLLVQGQGLRSFFVVCSRDDHLGVEELLLLFDYLGLIVPLLQELALSELLVQLLYILHLLLGMLSLFLLEFFQNCFLVCLLVVQWVLRVHQNGILSIEICVRLIGHERGVNA